MKFFLLILLTMSVTAISFAEEWKGIVPGVATRSDVIRLLQTCEDRTLSCEFDLDGDKIRIVFSGSVQNHFYQCIQNLPAETVLVVEVTPRKPIKLNTLRQSHSLRKVGKTYPFAAYIDEHAGLILKANKDEVIQLNYVAAASNRDRCKDYYDNPIKFVTVVTHCPPVTVEGPQATVIAGDVIHFRASAQPDPKMTLVWIVSGGKILTQTDNQMSLDTNGLDGQILKVTVEARGACSVENSMTLQIQPRKPRMGRVHSPTALRSSVSFLMKR